MPSTETVTNFPFFRFFYYYYFTFFPFLVWLVHLKTNNGVRMTSSTAATKREIERRIMLYVFFSSHFFSSLRFVSRTCNLNEIYTNTGDGIRGGSIGVHISLIKMKVHVTQYHHFLFLLGVCDGERESLGVSRSNNNKI